MFAIIVTQDFKVMNIGYISELGADKSLETVSEQRSMQELAQKLNDASLPMNSKNIVNNLEKNGNSEGLCTTNEAYENITRKMEQVVDTQPEKVTSWAECQSGNTVDGYAMYTLESGKHSDLLNSYPPPCQSIECVQTQSGNTLTFTTDEWSRCKTVEIEKIERVDGIRDEYQQQRCNELKDGFKSDDAGHILAREFGGPPEQINLLPMDSYTNRHGEWRNMEREWGRSIDEGKSVTDVIISPQYEGTSKRPVGFEVSYQLDGQYEARYIDNTPTKPII